MTNSWHLDSHDSYLVPTADLSDRAIVFKVHKEKRIDVMGLSLLKWGPNRLKADLEITVDERSIAKKFENRFSQVKYYYVHLKGFGLRRFCKKTH